MADRYIVIPNWQTFQHYRDRTPKWIKTYVELLSNDDYLSLSGHQRAVLHGLWLEYASSRCHLRLNTSLLSARLGLRVMTRDLEALNHGVFIDFSASAPLAQPEHAASLDREVDKKRPSTSNGATPKPAPKPLGCTGCTLTFTRERDLRDHLDNVHWLEGDALDQAVTQAVRDASAT